MSTHIRTFSQYYGKSLGQVVFQVGGEAIFLVSEWPLGPWENADCRKEDMTDPGTLAFGSEIYLDGSLAEFPQGF